MPDAVNHSVDASVQDVIADAQLSVDQMQQEIGAVAQNDVTDSFLEEDNPGGGIEFLGDVELDVTIELGRTEMLVEDILKLQSGSVVELDKLAGDPVDVYVNGRLVARGEVLVLNDNFCIRISEIIANLEEQAAAVKQQVEEMAAETDSSSEPAVI